MNEFSFEKLDTRIIFSSRPEAIPGDLRPIWRISIILLILHLASRGGKATLSKLHVLNWAIRTDENRAKLIQVIQGGISPDTIIVRIEPSLNRAIDFARGEGLLEFVKGNRVQLTPQGMMGANNLLEQDGIFLRERAFLEELGKNGLTEKVVDSLFSEGR